MKMNVTEHDFTEAFRTCGRGDSFSYEGLKALYEYLVDLEESMGEEFELDPVAIDCDFCEYDTALQAAEEYGYDDSGEYDEEDDQSLREDLAREWLYQNTSVIETSNSIIIQGF